MWAACGDAQIEPLKLVIPTNCHGPQKRATQANVELISRADARLLGGPIKSGHDDTALAFARDDKNYGCGRIEATLLQTQAPHLEPRK